MIDSYGRLFGKFNLIDALGVLVASLITIGFLLVQSGFYKTSGQVIQGEGDIDYVISLRGVQTLKPDLFKPGKKLSITVRNQPRGEVHIVDVTQAHMKEAFLLSSGQVKVFDAPTDPDGYNYLVTLRDHATFTEDGYVTEGVKIKIGLHIEVEGKDYRISGLIVDVHPAKAGTGKSVSQVLGPGFITMTGASQIHAKQTEFTETFLESNTRLKTALLISLDLAEMTADGLVAS